MADGVLIAQCRCGTSWEMDFEPAPEVCEGEVWRLGIRDLELDTIEWGVWVDAEGNNFVEDPKG